MQALEITTNTRQTDFPGFVIPTDKETPPARLKVTVTVNIQDRETGERFTKQIPGEFYRGKDVYSWALAALRHPRTEADFDAFLRDRNV